MGPAVIAVLGPLTVDGGVALGPRDRVVLAALTVHPGAVVSAERLADALWGERPPASWKKVVPGCVMRLRRVLGPEAIETLPHGYRLAVPAEEVDAYRFVRLVGRGRALLTEGEPDRAAYVLGEALGLWRGRALVELADWELGRIEAERLEALRLDAEEDRIDACLQVGQYREVLGEAQARVAEAPLRERRWALFALAQYQGGRQGEALRTLHQARTVLATELGLDPGPELVGLEQAILSQDPALVAEVVRTQASDTCPYLGLVPYDVADAEGFFGRDAEVAECVRRLADTGVLAVVGPSGCGKSSLVRAGVAAALQRQGRRVVVMTPGASSLDALTSLDARDDAVLVVDQCEEAVSQFDDPDMQAAFFAALAACAERRPVVVAVRADRLGVVSVHAGFARLVERGLYLLGAMDEANLRAAVEGPAHQGGLLVEAGLVDLLVRDVEAEPGALPLLSHALRTTWERREGRTPDRRGLPRDRWHPRGRRPVRGGGVPAGPPRAAGPAARPAPPSRRSRDRRRADARSRASAHPGRRCRPRAADRATRRRPARDERRPRRRAGPRGADTGLAPAPGLARGRRRGSAHPPPPHRGGRRVGHHGPTRQ